MKKTVLLAFAVIFIFLFCGCDTFKDAAESFKTDKVSTEEHSHQKHDDKEDTSVNLNLKDYVSTTKNEDKSTTNIKENKTTKKHNEDNDAEYPYTNVNDGDETVYEWPKEGLAAEFPELKSGTMKKPFISKTTFSVYFANVDPVEFDKYISELKKLGFTVDDSTDLYLYVATNNKIKVEFFYDTSKLGNNTLSLVATYLDK